MLCKIKRRSLQYIISSDAIGTSRIRADRYIITLDGTLTANLWTEEPFSGNSYVRVLQLNYDESVPEWFQLLDNAITSDRFPQLSIGVPFLHPETKEQMCHTLLFTPLTLWRVCEIDISVISGEVITGAKVRGIGGVHLNEGVVEITNRGEFGYRIAFEPIKSMSSLILLRLFSLTAEIDVELSP
jgi:hypothetical protein